MHDGQLIEILFTYLNGTPENPTDNLQVWCPYVAGKMRDDGRRVLICRQTGEMRYMREDELPWRAQVQELAPPPAKKKQRRDSWAPAAAVSPSVVQRAAVGDVAGDHDELRNMRPPMGGGDVCRAEGTVLVPVLT